jgi:hypothetical protein
MILFFLVPKELESENATVGVKTVEDSYHSMKVKSLHVVKEGRKNNVIIIL